MNVTIEDQNIFIKDILSRAFVLSLGSSLPKEDCINNMVSWIRLRNEKEQTQLNEEYVYNSVPRFINFLFDKS
tara:strand:- start:43 stop:261 length:219 start_codon:yes stop_codon:yes gene_type:complete